MRDRVGVRVWCVEDNIFRRVRTPQALDGPMSDPAMPREGGGSLCCLRLGRARRIFPCWASCDNLAEWSTLHYLINPSNSTGTGTTE